MQVTKMKERQSNIELLRIAAMLLVVLVHSTFFSNGSVTHERLVEHPISTLYYSFIEALALICVDCYILVSGYFSIRPKWRSFFNLLFIVYFYRYVLTLIDILFLGREYTYKMLLILLDPFCGEWFIGAYVALYIMSPILNGFANNSGKGELRNGLILYLAAMFALGWLLPARLSPTMHFDNGYTVLSFIGLYLIGRYVRLHLDSEKLSKKTLLGIYLGACAINAIIYVCIGFVMEAPQLAYINTTMFVSYDSPFTVGASVAILLLFTKIKVKSKVINWLAASSFSVYLIHLNPVVVPYFVNMARQIYTAFWPWLWLPVVLVFICAVYLICTFADQARKAVWYMIIKCFNLLTKSQRAIND